MRQSFQCKLHAFSPKSNVHFHVRISHFNSANYNHNTLIHLFYPLEHIACPLRYFWDKKESTFTFYFYMTLRIECTFSRENFAIQIKSPFPPSCLNTLHYPLPLRYKILPKYPIHLYCPLEHIACSLRYWGSQLLQTLKIERTFSR